MSTPNSAHPEASDHSLMVRWRSGNADAFTQIYFRYAERLRALAAAQTGPALAGRIDPEDIVQSVFRTFFRKAVQGCYDVPDGEEIWKLLLVIALNKIRFAAAYHRAAKRDARRTSGSDALEVAPPAIDGAEEQALVVLRLVIEDILSTLTPLHRRVVDLRVQGFEVAEIAAEIGRSKRTVERGLQQFRDKLNAQVRTSDQASDPPAPDDPPRPDSAD